LTIGKTRPAPEKKPANTVYEPAFASPSSPAYAAIVDYNKRMAAVSDLFYDQDGERVVAASGVITALREVDEESLNALDDDIDTGPVDAEKAGRGGPAALMSYQTSPGSALAFQTRDGRWVVARVLKREQGGLALHWVMQPDRSSRFPSIDTVLRDIENRAAAKPLAVQLYQAVKDNAASPDKVASLIDDFVKSGADINALVEPVGDGALHAAALYGVPSTVDALLNAGARVDLRSRGGATALVYAAKFGRTDNAKVLLAHGADPLAQMPDGRTAVQIASQARPENPELVALLLSHIDRSVMSLSTAASVGDVQAVQAAMDRKEPIDGADGRGFTPLYYAASMGHLDVVELLVKAGANPYAASSPRRLSPFVAAITNDHGKVAEAMLAEGIPKDTNVAMTALGLAIRKDMTGLVVQLVNRLPGQESREHAKELVLQVGSESTVSAVVDDMSTVPAWVAARIGAVDVLQQILEGKPDLAEYNSDGLTALHVAVQNSNVECARLLLSAGANPSAPTLVQRATALHFSAMGGGREIIDELLKSGADVNAVSKEGFTPLYYAVLFRRAEVVKTLLEHRAAVKDVPEPSLLANLIRMARDNKDIVKLLKRSGTVR
jgi:ankyrin repeat protein